MSCQFPPRDQTMAFDVALNDKYHGHGYPERTGYYTDAEGQAVWLQQYLLYRTNGEGHESAQAHVFADIDAIWFPAPTPVPPEPGPTPPPGSDVRPITGYLRTVQQTWGDDSGVRSVRVCSYFPALRDFKDRRDACLRNLDRMMGRWHGCRVFWHLADPWAPFGKDVRPSWGDFDQLFTDFLRACQDRQLRVSLTAGDLQYLDIGDYEALIPRIAGLCKSVSDQVVAVTGMVNEARVNSWSEVANDPHYWRERIGQWQQTYPWGMQSTSDPVDSHGDPEIPSVLRAWAQPPAAFSLVHGTRQGPIDAIRRAYNVKYEGVPELLINQDEPTGLLSSGTGSHNIRVYLPLPTKEYLFGLYSTIVLTGQLLTHFDDLSLTNTENHPIDSCWGFKELPALWTQMQIPEDVGTYRLIPGHKPEAPITIEGIPGNAPGRCDNMARPDGSRGYAVIYGETATTPGQWRIRSRVGAVQGFVWGASGAVAPYTGTVDVPSHHEAVVVEWHR